MEWMKANGITIYIQSTAADILERVLAEQAERPLLKNLNKAELLFFIEQKTERKDALLSRCGSCVGFKNNPCFHFENIIITLIIQFMHKKLITIGAVVGAATVALGAFGAHALKSILSASALVTYETGVRYQFYHCIALILAGILYQQYPSKWLLWSGRLFIAGIPVVQRLFVPIELPRTSYRWLGAITPFGT
jgi:uncharacterized membrane protein YgdD (TMEM256/DUF423 family)